MRVNSKMKILVTFLMALLLLAACGKEKDTPTNTPVVEVSETPTAEPVASNTPAATATPTCTLTPTNTSTPTPTPEVYLNDLGIEGLRFDETVSDSVTHFLSTDLELFYEGSTLCPVQIAIGGNGQLAILYSAVPGRIGESDQYDGSNMDYYLAFASMVGDKVRLDKKLALGKAQYCWLDERGESFIITRSVEGEDNASHKYIQIFDYSGQEYTTAAMKEGCGDGLCYLSGDMLYYYEANTKDYTISKVSFETGEKTEINYPTNLLLQSLYGVTNIKGIDYICGIFMGTDLKGYECVVNSETGELLYAAISDDIGYLGCESNRFTIVGSYGEDGTDTTIFDGDQLITYTKSGDYSYTYKQLGDKLVVVHASYEVHSETITFEDGEQYSYEVIDKSIIQIALVDLKTGLISNSNRIENKGERDLSNVSFLDENRLYICFTDMAGAMEIYIWTLDDVQHSQYDFSDMGEIKVEEFTGFELPEIYGRYNSRYDFIPGECPEELAEEREYADQLEQKYGIKIYIADEAKGLMSGYVFEALTDKATLRACLETMEREFGKYPEGFFSLYKKLEAYPDGLELYFTGGLIGYESGNLSQAGGLRTEDEDSINIALDGYDGRYEAAVHHELSHSIEVLIRELGSEKLDEEYWNSINVKYGGDRTYYANSYERQDSDWLYGYKDNYKYTLEYWMPLSRNWDYSSILFYDDYAMTYPTEDRSRIFELIMWDDMTFEKYPALNEKLVYYSSLIRKMLEDNGITSDSPYYWEKAIKVSEDEK